LIYFGYLGSCVLFIASVALAIGSDEPNLLLQAALAATVAFLLRQHLATHDHLVACAAEDDMPATTSPITETVGSAESRALIARCAELEALRGTPRFDPWELLQLRRALSAKSNSR
jgi:hypothetical protein